MNKTTYHKHEQPIAVDIDTLASMLSCGHATARKIGMEAHAAIRVNRRLLFSVAKVIHYIDNMAE